MSRLEEIKTRFNAMKELENFKKLAPTDLFFDDLNWLLQQAERVEELEKENRLLRFIAEENKIAYEQRAKQNKRYREVIKKAIDDLENECLWDALIALKALEGEE